MDRETLFDKPVKLRPLEDFNDKYGDPTQYETVDQARVSDRASPPVDLAVSPRKACRSRSTTTG